MANNRKTTKGRNRIQVIYSEPRRVFIERYLTPKGERLLKQGVLTKKEADEKYGKNRYRINTEAHPVKLIKHKY